MSEGCHKVVDGFFKKLSEWLLPGCHRVVKGCQLMKSSFVLTHFCQ